MTRGRGLGTISEHRAISTYVDIGDRRQPRVVTYVELSGVQDEEALVARTVRFGIRRRRGRRY